MEQNEDLKPAANEFPANAGIVASSLGSRGEMIPSQQSQEESCPTCGRLSAPTPPSYIYTICQIEPRFRDISVEKEFAQATGRAATAGLTDRQAFYETLKQNRYLVRQLCWVASIKAVDTYILIPDEPSLVEELIETTNPNSNPMDKINVVIGLLGNIAPPQMCNGLMIPIVFFDQLYFFDRPSLLAAIPRPEKVSEEQFKASTEQLFGHIMQMTDNAGATDEHRALNYLAVRYPRIYEVTYNAFQQNKALSEVKVIPSSLSGSQKIVKVIFSYTDRQTNVIEKHCTDVAVQGMFPYLVTPLSPYYDR